MSNPLLTLPFLLAAVIPVTAAAQDARSTADATDLGALQARIDALLERASAATVGIRIGAVNGSGVLVSPDGLVLTAAHVSEGAGRRARVFLADGRELEARTLGRNPLRDSGLLRISTTEELPFVHVPEPGTLRPGDWCVALGHPGGFQKDRPPLARLGRILDPTGLFLRTDCPIIGGDSGGPLFDRDGGLIGIHSRIEADVATNYHVPMSTFRLGWKRLLAGEEWTTSDAKLGLRRMTTLESGVRVDAILAGRAADRAGLRAGDVIRRLAGEVVHDSRDLRWFLGDLSPGDEVVLELERGQQIVRAAVTLAGKREPQDPQKAQNPQKARDPEKGPGGGR